ncbi:GTPase [Rhodococcoides fascians]|uniref:GTPase n=1 Tax=Rhodococcoides fascians TaxID=1828 RepID=UPI00055DFB9E|nr:MULTISPECIES: GTPase [Rhodococcus]OZF01334.1 GTPase [Rhodococcus sp. 15-1189-1-1a]OZF15504.1 GTPase [Rhodococcus sp. 14-2686-1-2]
MTAPQPPLDPVRAGLDRALHALAALGPETAAHANRIGALLWSPPRIVIIGRLKAGKSTLVNALVGAKVADTAALEATTVVSVYQEGAPARAEAVLLDNRRVPVPTDRGAVTDLPVAPHEIAYLHRWLPSAAIRDYTLVDTPGLATLTAENEARTRRVLIDGFEQTRTASVEADAAVFLFDGAPRADEIDFLRQLGFTPLTTLGVLSRADGFGEGALGVRDPLQHAAEHAARLAGQLADTVMTVVPVAGLLAETSHTGALTEADARALHALAGIALFDLIDLLDSDDDALVPPQVRGRLVDLLGEYGVLHGREIAAAGAAALNEWLVACSGVAALHRILSAHLGVFAAVKRAYRILGELDRLAYTRPEREQIRDIVDRLRSDPALHTVVLFGHLEAMLGADPASPVTAELRRLVEQPTPAMKLGISPDAGPEQIRAAARDKLTWAHTQALTTFTAAEDAALVVLIQTYALLQS